MPETPMRSFKPCAAGSESGYREMLSLEALTAVSSISSSARPSRERAVIVSATRSETSTTRCPARKLKPPRTNDNSAARKISTPRLAVIEKRAGAGVAVSTPCTVGVSKGLEVG